MDRNTLNNNWTQTILYYCFQTDGSFHMIDCSDVGTWGYDEDYNLIINTWLLGISQPSIETLMSYQIADVLHFYNYSYFIPSTINVNPFVSLSNAQLSEVPTARLEEGKIFYNTTLKRNQYWDGNNFITL